MKLDELFSALSNPTRRRIIEVIAFERAATSARLTAEFSMSASAVAQHLTWMREIGLIKAVYAGKIRQYSLDDEALDAVLGWLSVVQAARSPPMDAM